MSLIPEPTATTAKAIDAYHESKKEKPRPHMGVSLLGHPCDRWLWLSFRWAIQEDFPGRILRLFRRGHHEENWIVQDLRAIGVIFAQLAVSNRVSSLAVTYQAVLMASSKKV